MNTFVEMIEALQGAAEEMEHSDIWLQTQIGFIVNAYVKYCHENKPELVPSPTADVGPVMSVKAGGMEETPKCPCHENDEE